MFKDGFTILEVIVSMALIGMVASLGLAVSMDGYRFWIFQNEIHLVMDILTETRTQAMEYADRSGHGMRIERGRVISFRGPDYLIDDSTNRIYPINVALVDINEIETFFEPLSGSPDKPVSFTMTDGIHNRKISINTEGVIED
jgi:prepilin-type N-terminal cleavage/methylation domain-containing protein